jgi:LysM repeat protein
MRIFLTGLLLLSILAGCTAKTSRPGPDLGQPKPYWTATPTRTPSVIPVLTEVLLPSPTPFFYTVRLGDTLIGIASRFGVSLEALQAANPSVQPTALTVGTQLVIPTGNELPGEPTSTPAGLALLQARCWPEAGGGLWCFALYQNGFAEAVENLSAQFVLLDAQGRGLASQVGYGLINVLPSGQAMPMAVHFAGPVDPPAGVRVQQLTANRLLPGDLRYLPVQVENSLVNLDPGDSTARLSGRVVLGGSGTANTVWVLAVGYDLAGNVVGVRRWEASSPLAAGGNLAFGFLLSSLGPAIARVDFLAEARP